MKRKYLLILTILVLAIILSGCASGIVTPDTNEAKIRSIINEYFSALNDQNWSKAKSYCIYGEDLYYDVIQWESVVNTLYSYCNIVNVNILVDILDVNTQLYILDVLDSVECCVQCVITDLSTDCDNYINNASAYLVYLHLEKVGNSWKLTFKHDAEGNLM
jgi:uncharacterized protein YceK